VGKVKQRYLAAVVRQLTEEIGEAPTEPDSIRLGVVDFHLRRLLQGHRRRHQLEVFIPNQG
jgi:hypothetical protein